MTPLAEVIEGLARQVNLIDGKGLESDSGPTEKHLALATGLCISLAVYYNRELQKCSGADSAVFGIVDDLGVKVGFWFAEQTANSAEVSRIIWEGLGHHTEARHDRRRDA